MLLPSPCLNNLWPMGKWWNLEIWLNPNYTCLVIGRSFTNISFFTQLNTVIQVFLVASVGQSLWHATWFVTRLTRCRWVSLVEQELLTIPEHLSSPPGFRGVRVTRSLVLCVCFVDCCLSFCTFSFGHCVVRYFFDIWILITPLVSSNSS